MSLGSSFDLKTWRKKFNLSQGKLADLAELSLNTIMKMESGAKDVQKRTIDRLLLAIKAVEDKVTVIPAETRKPTAPVAPAPVAPVVAPIVAPPVVAKPVDVAAPTPKLSVPAPVVTPDPAVAPTPVAAPAPQVSMATLPVPPQVAPLQLTNLDLELINRVILMSVKQKLRMLELMMDEETGA
jgi:DNA-binding XRE family transcriptional regulator